MIAAIGLILLTIAGVATLTVLRGLVLQALWTWFVASTFDVTTLTLGDAIGLSLVVSFLTYQYDARADDDADGGSTGHRIVTAFIAGLLINLLALGCGALVHGLAS